MFEKIFYFLILFLWSPSIIIEFPQPQWIIWNVGQGQWVTQVKGHHCIHFDFGGEINPIKEVYKYCSWRNNHLILSHPDRDHYNFIKSIRETLKLLCLEGPSWKNFPLKKLGVSQIKNCAPSFKSEFEFGLSLGFPSSYFQTTRKQILFQKKHSSRPKLDKNLKSQIYHSKRWLIPGDAPQTVEKDWLLHTPDNEERLVTRLLLGHHGSKTSTSVELLHKLTQLNQCISSSREKKYGHPHKDVRNRIKSFCSLVRTEDWNHIHYLEGL